MSHPPTVLDGGLATSLQEQGLAPFTPVNDWLLAHPERVASVHQAMAQAGAQVVLAGTFRCLPHLDERWQRLVPAAIDCAASAGVTVACSVGPPGTPERAWDGDPGPLIALTRLLAGDPRPELLVLETFTDGAELIAAVRAVRPHWKHTLVACLSPAPSGALWCGDAIAPWLASARRAGADLVGLNCGPGVISAAGLARRSGVEVDWLKPNADDRDLDLGSPGGLSPLLDRDAAHIGGCCGWDAGAIASLSAMVQARFSTGPAAAQVATE